MGLFDFFKRKPKSEHPKMDAEKPSAEQTAFAEQVLETISPTVEHFGFKLYCKEVKTYSTTIVWRKDKQYIKVNSTDYPTDYPYYYNIILGEGNSDDFFEYDWNSVAVWALARVIEPTADINSYDFPLGDKVKYSLSAANNHLLKYGQTFLSGDLTVFYEARKQINENREPYKIYKPGQDGKYHTTDEPMSVKQKKKHS
jgi:hypothetical protein